MLLDRILPDYEFHEVHHVRLSVPPERALEVVNRVTPDEMPLVRVLFAARSLPGYVGGGRGLPAKKTASL